MMFRSLLPAAGSAALPRRSRSCAKDSPSKCWSRHHAIEALLAADAHRGDVCFGRAVTLADVYLMPQVESARRFKVDMGRWPLIVAVDAACAEIDAFHRAAPAMQPDAA